MQMFAKFNLTFGPFVFNKVLLRLVTISKSSVNTNIKFAGANRFWHFHRTQSKGWFQRLFVPPAAKNY